MKKERGTINNDKKIVKQIVIYSVIMFFIIISFTIAYSAFHDSLSISDSVTHVRVDKVVRINGVNLNVRSSS